MTPEREFRNVEDLGLVTGADGGFTGGIEIFREVGILLKRCRAPSSSA